jgi:hypothetical protein
VSSFTGTFKVECPYGGTKKIQNDHGENGAGLGASHQTGWTGLVAYLMKMGALITHESALHTESIYAAISVKPGKPTST